MPFYTFDCDTCGSQAEMFWTMNQYERETEIVDSTVKLKVACPKCGGKYCRKFEPVNLGPDIYKNDPNSNQYWKIGKTHSQISGILSDDNASPY
jgi:predicted nucleic acid-binding Zn ribbon protein